MIEKIKKAFIEGALLQKTSKFIKKKFRTLIQKIDYTLSGLVRRPWCKRQPVVKNRIVFSIVDNRFDCNPKYIINELLRRGLPCDLICIVKPEADGKNIDDFPPQIKVLPRGSYEAFYATATAKIWIENELKFLKPYAVPKKENQIYINTWHGSLGFKKIGRANEMNSKGRLKRFITRMARLCDQTTDYLISNSEFERNVFREAYWDNTPILEYGHARNDILLKEDKSLRTAILERLELMPALPDDISAVPQRELDDIMSKRGFAEGKRYVLYAPSYHQDGSVSHFNIDYAELKRALHMRFGGTWEVLVRLHLHDRKSAAKLQQKNKFKDVSSYPDMQELLYLADVGISDYSSWLCDYLLTGRPGFIYADDINDYANQRGFYYPLEETPFPISATTKELSSNILQFDSEKFEENRRKFLEDKGCMEDGHAAERIADLIEKIIGDTDEENQS